MPGPDDSPSSRQTDFVDIAITEFDSLGWLGAQSQPLNIGLTFTDPDDPDQSVTPGGLVVRALQPESPAANAGFKVGDVIVGIENEWLPINDNPTLDFMREVESRVASTTTEIELQIFREGRCQSITLPISLVSLDEGLPYAVRRYSDAAVRGLSYLAGLQQADGSFGSESLGKDARLQITSLAGLAFLAAAEEQFIPAADAALKYVGAELDSSMEEEPSESLPVETSDDLQPDTAVKTIMALPKVDLDPLTASYVAMFLSESNIGKLDQTWMRRQLAVIGSLSTSQHQSGAWLADRDSPETSDSTELERMNTVANTFVTNQVVLAMGMLERNGLMMNQGNDSLQRACKYLKSQLTARAAQDLDRRIKAGLDAGTAAALVSINCQRSDPTLSHATESGLTNINERPAAPSVALPGLLATAVLARQTDKQNWIRFYQDTKHWLISLQSPDGRFARLPDSGYQPLDLESQYNDPAWQAAHYCLLLAMPSGNLKRLTAQEQPPTMMTRNSDGQTTEGQVAGQAQVPQVPEGARMIQLDFGDLQGEDLQEALREKLKEEGIEIGEGQIQGLDKLPKKDKDD